MAWLFNLPFSSLAKLFFIHIKKKIELERAKYFKLGASSGIRNQAHVKPEIKNWAPMPQMPQIYHIKAKCDKFSASGLIELLKKLGPGLIKLLASVLRAQK